MAVSFKQVPSSSKVPFVFIEVDGAQAQQGGSDQPYKVLVIGQLLAAGSVAQKIPKLVTNVEQAVDFFGEGSVLHQMAVPLFANNKNTQTTFIGLDDPAGAAATGTITVTGTATKGGTLSLYVTGQRLQIAVSDGDTATIIGDAIEAAINAQAALPITAANAVGVVTMTANHVGAIGNDIDVRFNRFAGEEFPAGTAYALIGVGSVVPGTLHPVVDGTLWAALGDEHFNVFAMGLSGKDQTTTDAIDLELEERADPVRAIEAMAAYFVNDTHAGLITVGAANLTKRYISMPGGVKYPNTPWEIAAAYGAVLAREAKVDPARPFQTLELIGILAPDSDKRFTFQENELLLNGGIATFSGTDEGKVQIQRAITMWQQNEGGSPDESFLDCNTLFTLSFMRFFTRSTIATKYPRHKLADDGTKFGAGQAVLTPSLLKAEILGFFRNWETRGLVEGFAQFKEDLIVERNADDPNRIDVVMPPDLINQLRVVGAAIRFLL